MFFDSLYDLLRVVLITALAYAALVLVLRLAGKRSLAKLNAFDLVVTVALGSTLATVLLSKDVSLLEGALAFIMLALLQWIVARLSVASPLFRDLVRSQPRLLFEDGQFRRSAMRQERVTEDEILAVIRSAGVTRVEDVAAVVLETDGTLSVIKGAGQGLTVLAGVRR
ncbi:DUF421 domain-containing protein [Erythrobacter donghaensis]|jgi:uncharacterized membrane protein YcaP (DUF421 family)|uniref:DUF421 domain-containing protein n=1 Tax=Erythrobacter donghaensis TaxID=267135 RepID=UPI0009392C46|nr:YetF domain-containing protein [Erythrobacter donghaensis]